MREYEATPLKICSGAIDGWCENTKCFCFGTHTGFLLPHECCCISIPTSDEQVYSVPVGVRKLYIGLDKNMRRTLVISDTLALS